MKYTTPTASSIFLLLALMCCCISASLINGPHPYLSIKDDLTTKQYATWVWNVWDLVQYDWITDTWGPGVDAKADFFTFITNETFTDIYINYDVDLFAEYNFTKKFLYHFNHNLGIAVHSLTSGNYMHRADHADHQKWLAFQTFINNYTTQLAADNTIAAEDKAKYQFVGVHVDNEPYMHDQWPADPNDLSDVKLFQDFHIMVRNWAHQRGLIFGTDVSDGFEWINYNSPEYGTGVLSNWMIKEMDFIVLMSYRLRTDLAIEASNTEIWAADGVNCTSQAYTPGAITAAGGIAAEDRYRRANGCAGVMWSLETDDQTWGEYFIERNITISFFNQTRKTLNDAISVIAGYYDENNYGGFAIHMLPTFKNMGGSEGYVAPDGGDSNDNGNNTNGGGDNGNNNSTTPDDGSNTPGGDNNSTTPGGDNNSTTPGGDNNSTTPGGNDDDGTPGEEEPTGGGGDKSNAASGVFITTVVGIVVVIIGVLF